MMGINGLFKRFAATWLSKDVEQTQPGASSRCTPACTPAIEPLEARVQFAIEGLPADAMLPDLAPLVNKQLGYVFKWSIDRQEKPGRTLLRLTTAMGNYGPGPMEIRGSDRSLTGQDVYQRIYNRDGSSTDRLAGNFTYHAHHDHTHFDDFAQFNLREITRKGGLGKVLRSGRKISFCLTDSDEIGGRIPGKSKQPRYDACSTTVQGISVGWADVYGQSLADQWIDITKVKPGRYWLEVTVDPDNRLVEANESNNTRRIQVIIKEMAKPANDDFSGRMALTGRTASVRTYNAAASLQPNEPDHAGVPGGTSLWWAWTAPASGRVAISTRGSTFDTLLGVYSGSHLAKLQVVTANDDDDFGDRTSRVTFHVRKGTTYQIAVDGYRGASGTIKLAIAML